MVRLSDGWKRLTEAVFSSEAVETTSESTKAFLELAKTFKEEGAKLETLKPLLEQSSSLLDFLCSPSIQLLGTALPFIPIATTVLKIYREKTHRNLNLEECIAVAIQTAYVASFKEVLSEQEYLWTRWNDKNNIKNIKEKIKKLDILDLDNEAAQIAITI